MEITQRTDFETDAQDALTDQFRKDKIKALAAVFAAQVQDLENVCFQILNGRTIATAEGVQLDGLGALVGEPRQGRDDDAYRIWIKARVRLNLSNGTPDQILDLVRLVLPDSMGDPSIIEYPPASLRVNVADAGALDAPTAAQIGALVQAAKPAGVRAAFIYSLSDAANTFTFSPDHTAHISTTKGLGNEAQTSGGHFAGRV